MLYLWMGLFAAGIVAADQLSKWWVVNHIASSPCYANGDLSLCAGHVEKLKAVFGLTDQQLGALPSSAEGIDGVFQLRHVHNTGAAFSSFEGMQWLFALVFILFTAAIVWEFSRKRWPFKTAERWLIVAIYAGGLGNMIDRLRLGFVVDMIDLEFAGNSALAWLNNFAVFNVADCFITCGCVLLIAHLIFFNKEFWKDEKK